MRLSSAYVLAIAAALASSVSATNADADHGCHLFCLDESDCDCGAILCVSFSNLRARFNHKVLWHR
ncbi:hypothetical protein P692DRAFT_201795412 [Suillus brevipes Sb2]|nr:hypothetical protein P692DRAFT_201795412 [Suillus brevipes Sb2]